MHLHLLPFPSPDEPPVPPEVFCSFHKVDRNLFSRLVFQLGRDPGESAKVVALWLWLEKSMNVQRCGREWIRIILLPSHPGPLNAVADESVAILNWIYCDNAPQAPPLIDLPMLRMMTGSTSMTLRDFFDHRVSVVQGVDEMFQQVCVRAFQDLMHWAIQERALLEIGRGQNGIPVHMVAVRTPMHFEQMVGPPLHPLPVIPPPPPQPQIVAVLPMPVSLLPPRPPFIPQGMVPTPLNHCVQYDTAAALRSIVGVNPNDDLLGVRELIFYNMNQKQNHELDNGVTTDHDHNGKKVEKTEEAAKEDVPSDDRTIFLTFSKGYPITKKQVKDFFVRKFGDNLIEALFMQDVKSSHNQPLYARLLVRSRAAVHVILGRRNKMKFTINGKHVWARKYVRKNVVIKNPPSKSSEEAPATQPATSSCSGTGQI